MLQPVISSGGLRQGGLLLVQGQAGPQKTKDSPSPHQLKKARETTLFMQKLKSKVGLGI